MPAFSRFLLTDKLACQGSVTQYGVLRPEDLVDASDVMAVEDQESLSFKCPRCDANGAVRAITAQLRGGRVITTVWSDGSFDEWRVRMVDDGRGQGGLVSVTCVPLWLDLVERGLVGWVSDLTGAVVRNYEYTLASRTLTDIWTNYVIPHCPSYVAAGTINPTVTIPSLRVSRLTPGALALAARDFLRSVDVACEVRLRRNGITNYLLDAVTQMGSSAATPVFHPSISLTSLRRRLDCTPQSTRVLVKGATDPTGVAGVLGRARWLVGTPSGNLLPLTDPNGGASPVQFDTQWVNAYLLRVKTGATFPITASAVATGSVTCGAGISTIVAGEFVEFRLSEPSTNTRTTTTRYAVSAVPDGTHITCGVSAPITADGQYTDWYARVWTLGAGGAIVATTRITGSVAATDVIAVASSAGVNNTHFVEFIQLDGNGEVPSYIDHPYTAADPTGYGMKVAEISRANQLGATNLALNGRMNTWPSSVAMPTGWLNPGGSTFGVGLSQNTNASFIRYGNYSLKFQSESGVTLGIQSPPIYVNFAGTVSNFVSVRAWLYFTNLAGAGAGANAILQLRTLDASGAVTGAVLATVTVCSNVSAPSATAPVALPVNAWVSVELVGFNLSAISAPYGLAVTFLGNSQSVNLIGYLDTIEAYGFASNPSQAYEFGDATILTQAGNGQLRGNASPVPYYELGVLDLERAFPNDFSRLALSIGGSVRAADTEFGIDATVRLLRRDRNLLKPTATRLTLANLPVLQSNLVSDAANVPASTTSPIPSTTDPGSFVNAAAAGVVTMVQGANIVLGNGVYLAAVASSAGTIAGATAAAAGVRVTVPGTYLLSP